MLRRQGIWVLLLLALVGAGTDTEGALLDDYSASQEASYQLLPVLNNPSDGWAVGSGVLVPSIPGNATGAWLWKGAELLNVGDFASTDFWIKNADPGLGTSAGLYFASSLTSPTVGAEVSLLTWGGASGLLEVPGHSTSVSGLPQTGFSHLTVTMSGQTLNSSTYSVRLSGGGGGDYTASFVFGANSAYFGPVVHGSQRYGDVAFDNLSATITAVPEPSTLVLFLLGVAGMVGRYACGKRG